MLAVKFRRVGKKHQASFQVVVVEKRSKINGRFIEKLGWLDPHQKKFDLKKERINYWLGIGAQPTDSVHNLLVKTGIIKGAKVPVHSTVKKSKKEESASADKAVVDKPTSINETTTAGKEEKETEKQAAETLPEAENKPEAKSDTEDKEDKSS